MTNVAWAGSDRVEGSERRKPFNALAIITIVGLTAVIMFLALAALVHGIASLQMGHKGPLTAAERLTATNAARSALGQLLLGVGVLGGLIFTARTYLLARQTQRNDRLTKAVEQIGNKESETVRSGGVYALWLLARESSAYWPVVEEILGSLVRERALPSARLGADVQAALRVLGQRPPHGGVPLNLSGTDLSKANLADVNLGRVTLDDANLEGAQLIGANLTQASLIRARLAGADLSGAKLTYADLTGASLRNADLNGATTRDTIMIRCDLEGVRNFEDAQRAVTIGL